MQDKMTMLCWCNENKYSNSDPHLRSTMTWCLPKYPIFQNLPDLPNLKTS